MDAQGKAYRRLAVLARVVRKQAPTSTPHQAVQAAPYPIHTPLRLLPPVPVTRPTWPNAKQAPTTLTLNRSLTLCRIERIQPRKIPYLRFPLEGQRQLRQIRARATLLLRLRTRKGYSPSFYRRTTTTRALLSFPLLILLLIMTRTTTTTMLAIPTQTRILRLALG